MAMDLSWLPPDTSPGKIPLGMRVNNPGNIKFFPGLKYPGMLGPSGPGHTDQGDPQMTFDTPQSGMNAAANLAWKKYRGGKRSPNALIAGQMGWTPGNTAAASNVARALGIDPNADMNLSDPKQMSAFLRALVTQEHGPSSKFYGDDLYQNAAAYAVNGQEAPPMKLGQTIPRGGYIGGTAAAPAQTVQPGMPPEALTPPSGRYSKLSEALLASAAGAKPRGWGELLNAGGDLALGYTLGDKADTQQKEYQSKLAKMLSGSDAGALPDRLIQSGDPSLMQAGVQAKMQQAQAQAKANAPLRGKERFLSTPGGVMDVETMQIVPGTEKDDGNKPIKVGDTLVQKGPDGKYVPVYQPQGAGEAGGLSPTAMKERDKAIGKAQGTALASLPTSLNSAEEFVGTVDKLLSDPGLEKVTGLYGGNTMNISPSSRRAQSMIDQLGGKAFLESVKGMRGTGALSDAEGAKVERAFGRLQSQDMDDADYKQALVDLRTAVANLYEVSQAEAGIPPEQRKRIPELPQQTQQSGQGNAAPVQIQTQQEYYALPPGTKYIAPDGTMRTKK